MLEALVATAVVAGGVAVLGRRQSAAPTALSTGRWALDAVGEPATDLPCPWCRAATAETDTHCPSCQQRFG